MVSSTFVSVFFCIIAMFALVNARPQPQDQDAEVVLRAQDTGSGGPMPYSYKWDVRDQESNNYYGQDHNTDESGNTAGSYYVLLPDGRLMTVTYTVTPDGGFKPIIKFEQNYKPDFSEVARNDVQ